MKNKLKNKMIRRILPAVISLSLFGTVFGTVVGHVVHSAKLARESEVNYIHETNCVARAKDHKGIVSTGKEISKDWDFDGINDDYVSYCDGTSYIRSSRYLSEHPFKNSWEKTFIREDLLPLRQEGILSELRHLDSLVSDLESGRISYAPDNTISQSRQSKLDELRKNYPGAYSKYVQGKNN